MVHAESYETYVVHSWWLARRKTVAVAVLQQASCNADRRREGMKEVKEVSAWPTRVTGWQDDRAVIWITHPVNSDVPSRPVGSPFQGQPSVGQNRSRRF